MSEGHQEETVPGLRAQKAVVSQSVRGQTTERLGALFSPILIMSSEFLSTWHARPFLLFFWSREMDSVGHS